MELFTIKPDIINNTNVEIVQKQKQEYKYLGSYYVTRGMTLFSFDFMKNEIKIVEINYSNTIYAVVRAGKLVAVDYEVEKVMTDSRLEFFESLNMKNEIKRVNKYLAGDIKVLCNLRTELNTSIDFFKL